MNAVYALTRTGEVTKCYAPEDKRGIGRCQHIAHQEKDESIEKFLDRVSEFMLPTENKPMEEITKEFIARNHNIEEVNWTEELKDAVYKNLTLGEEHCELKEAEVETKFNKYGDEVDHITLHIMFRGQEYECDFGEIPHVQDDGTISIKNVDYRCLPVLGKNKIGYGQGFQGGIPTVWLLQKDGNMGINIPLDGESKVKVLGSLYDRDVIEQAVINGEYPDDPKIDSLIKSLDWKYIQERNPEFGKEGWMQSFQDNFTPDEINDITYRRVYTYKDQVKSEMLSQLRRMGVTFRSNLMSKDGQSNGNVVITQKNNTDNIIENLSNRSNVQLAETLNPLAAYSQANKISLTGREGYDKDSVPEALRHPGESFKGMTDPMDQSSGKNIGLTVFLKNAEVRDGIIRRTEEPTVSLTDFVPFRNHNNPNRVSMASSQLRQSMQLVNGEDPKLLGDPTSDRAWGQIKGAKIGRMAHVAYLPEESTWEDSCSISESFAKNLEAVKTYKFMEDPKWKDGDQVKVGDVVGGSTVKYPGTLHKRKGGVGFEMEAHIPCTVSDKITDRYGCKNTIGRIIPDADMPKVYDDETGKYVPADIVRSPLSIGKRGNIGTIIETRGFDKDGNVDIGTDRLRPIKLPDGKTVKNNSGEQFICRLNQVGKEKSYGYGGEMQPDREYHSRLSEMDSILMSTTENRRQIMRFLRSQGNDEKARLDEILAGIGVKRVD